MGSQQILSGFLGQLRRIWRICTQALTVAWLSRSRLSRPFSSVGEQNNLPSLAGLGKTLNTTNGDKQETTASVCLFVYMTICKMFSCVHAPMRSCVVSMCCTERDGKHTSRQINSCANVYTYIYIYIHIVVNMRTTTSSGCPCNILVINPQRVAQGRHDNLPTQDSPTKPLKTNTIYTLGCANHI